MRTNHSTEKPFLRIAPHRLTPFVLTCEHARGDLPRGIRTDTRDRAVLRSHWGWDIGAWLLTRETARLLRTGATGGRWTRLWIDLNRPAGDPTIIRREIKGHELPWNTGLDRKERLRRYAEVHAPYHAEIDREIALRVSCGVRPVLLAIHTFTPVVGTRVRRFDAGVLYDENRAEAGRLAVALREAGLSVRYNEPYSGKRGLMYSIDRHGRHHRLPCLELEINQVMFERSNVVRTLARVVARGMRDIEERTRDRH